MQKGTARFRVVSREFWLLAGGAAVLAISVIAVAGRPVRAQGTGAASAPAGPAGPAVSDHELDKLGVAAVSKACLECHPFDDIVVLRRTPKEWRDVVTQMVTKGAVGTESEFATIRQYLIRFYGLVPVNSALAPDLTAVLGLTAKEAEAIVEYRKSHGKFTDVASLLKVPGLDKEKVEADPDALKFD